MNKVALVTGAANGIGRAISLRLADDGFNLAINDIHSQSAALLELQYKIESNGRRCVVVPADVSSENEVIKMIDNTIKHLGQLNVMIANAGVIVVKPILELETEDWDRVQAINVRGVFLCYKFSAKQMITQGNGGKIIGACSISGYRPSPQAAAYSVSKWAIRELTQAAAQEFAGHNITVNAYCPGMVRTDMWNVIDSTLAANNGASNGAVWEASVQQRIALKRPQTPQDIAGMVSFLAGNDSNEMTGQSLIMDGGIVFS